MPRLQKRNAKLRYQHAHEKQGLGAVLIQHCGDRWRALAYTSGGLTSSEFNFTQTEKRATDAVICLCTAPQSLLNKVWDNERINNTAHNSKE